MAGFDTIRGIGFQQACALDDAVDLVVKAVTDPDWQAASQALDELMSELIVIQGIRCPLDSRVG